MRAIFAQCLFLTLAVLLQVLFLPAVLEGGRIPSALRAQVRRLNRRRATTARRAVVGVSVSSAKKLSVAGVVQGPFAYCVFDSHKESTCHRSRRDDVCEDEFGFDGYNCRSKEHFYFTHGLGRRPLA